MVWAELKKLESVCDVSVRSYLDDGRTLRWMVVVRPHDSELEPFQADEVDLHQAVCRVVELAREKKLLCQRGPADGG